MKIKHLFPAAALALVMTACTADQLVQSPDSGEIPISFRAYTGNMTRAAHSYNKTPDGSGVTDANSPYKFTVAAYSPSNLLFFKDDVNYTEKEGTTWWYAEETHYWPNGSVDFYAVIDDDGKFDCSQLNEDQSAFINKVPGYAVDTDVSKQLDLMYAVLPGQNKSDYETNNITLYFKHALSQICFNIENKTQQSIDIYSITLGGIYGKGDFTLPNVKTESGSTISNNSWTGHDSTAKYKLSKESGALCTITSDGSFCVYNDYGPSGDNFPGYAMNLIPQNVPASEALNVEGALAQTNEGAYIIVQTKPIEEGGTLSDDNSKLIPLPVDWQPGYRYIYNLIFNPGAAKIEMKWSVNTEDFSSDPIKEYIENDHYAVKMGTVNNQNLYLATCNVGANNPWETGNYFWWGDADKGQSEASKYYIFSDKVETYGKTMTELLYGYLSTTSSDKYVETKDEGDSTNWYKLNGNHDAAYMNWKQNWRMPTKQELDWLMDPNNVEWIHSNDATDGYINWEYTAKGESKTKAYTKTTSGTDGSTTSKVPGYYLKSRETGGVIFLPATGKLSYDQTVKTDFDDKEHLYYWSASIIYQNNYAEGNTTEIATNSKPWYITDNGVSSSSTSSKADVKSGDCFVGMAIRPVINK